MSPHGVLSAAHRSSRRPLLELSHHTMDWLGIRWAGGGSIWPIAFMWVEFI